MSDLVFGKLKRPRWGNTAAVLAVLAPFGLLHAGLAQGVSASQASPTQNAPASSRSSRGLDGMDASGPIGQPNPMRLQHLREEERRKRLQADMEKLVSLTNELKAELDKTSKDELSLDVVRKAAEIEKLAHDVKERMKS